MDRKDSGCAKLKLQSVLSREPNCAEALFIKAFVVEYYDEKPEDAKRLRKRALELNPKLTEFWEKRGHYIESQLTTQEFTHFSLEFYGAEDRQRAWTAVKYLNEMYNELGSAFGTFPSEKITVIVFTTMDYVDTWRMPFTGGFFDKRDGKVRLRVDEMPGGEREFRHRCRHELTHAYFYQMYPHDLPGWVSEGAAEFYGRSTPSDGFWKDNRLEEIRKFCKPYQKLTLAQIQEAIGKKKGTLLNMQLAYIQSEALVLFVAKDRGDSWIPRVITHLRQHGGTFDDAFQAVLQTSAASMMERLRHAWE